MDLFYDTGIGHDKDIMTENRRIISPDELVDMATYAGSAPLRIDIVYAQAAHPDNMFKEAIYRPGARLWLVREFAEVVALAATEYHRRTGNCFVLKDGLRTVDAQEKILQTKIIQENMHWVTGTPRLFSPPGAGGHPRGMAIDITLQAPDGTELEMGVPFDTLPNDPAGENPAARDYQNLPADAKQNRAEQRFCMEWAAQQLNRPILCLPAEYWDYRLPPDYINLHAPLRDDDLPPAKKMVLGPA